jgi:hypothetical protein
MLSFPFTHIMFSSCIFIKFLHARVLYCYLSCTKSVAESQHIIAGGNFRCKHIKVSLQRLHSIKIWHASFNHGSLELHCQLNNGLFQLHFIHWPDQERWPAVGHQPLLQLNLRLLVLAGDLAISNPPQVYNSSYTSALSFFLCNGLWSMLAQFAM